MAVKNFIPELWEAKILKELDKQQVLVKNCTQKWSGQITGKGSKVKINSVNEPVIGDYVSGVTVITPQEIMDESRMLEITEAKYFAIKLDDIDDKQSTGGILEEAIRKATVGLNNAAEAFVASKFADAAESVAQASLTAGNFFSTFMKAKRKLMRNNVSLDMEVCAEVTPEVWEKGVLANILFNNQDNGDMIRTGQYVTSLGMKFYISNNIPVTVTSEDVVEAVCCLHTKEAIGFASQIMKVEKYRPESAFEDAAKGLYVYGAKMIKPKEAVKMTLKTAAETVV